MRLGRLLLAVALVLVSAAGCSGPTAPSPSGPLVLRRVSGTIPDDSAFRSVRAPLVYEVVDRSGVPASGVRIRFRSGDSTANRPGPGTPFVWTSALPELNAVNTDNTVPADSSGRVAVRVTRGIHAGHGWLFVTVDSLGLADSIPFRILMQTPQFIRIEPQDTTLLRGSTFPIRAYLTDAAGNVDSVSPILRTDSSSVTVVSGTVTGVALGKAIIEAQFGALSTRATVSVVPDGRLVMLEATNSKVSVVLTRTDGTGRRLLYSQSTTRSDHWSFDWLDSNSLVMPNPSGDGLLRIGLDGTGTVIPLALPADGRSPRWVDAGPDSRTVYFAYQGEGPAEIWRGDIVTGATSLVLGSNFRYIDTFPAIAQDGRTLAFTTTRTGIATIGVVDLGAASPPLISSLRGVAARWLPDGQRFVYVAAPYLRVARIDGSDQRYLTPVSGVADIGFDMSPDGRWIAGRGHPRITLVDVESGLTVSGPRADNVLWVLWQR